RLEGGVELRGEMAELWLLLLCPGHLGPLWRHPRYPAVGTAPERLDGQRRLDGIGCPPGDPVSRGDEADLWRRRKLPAHAGRVLSKGLLHPPRDARESYAAGAGRRAVRVQGVHGFLLAV